MLRSVARLHRFPLSKWAMRAKLPPTDDRLRPDMRLFEHGYFQEVSSCSTPE